MNFDVVTEGLVFPEGPVWMEDGSVIVVEVGGGRITRVQPDGRKETVATPGGGPNGAAIGPDGALYLCNNGGIVFSIVDGKMQTAGDAPDDYDTGRIERIDLKTGKVDRLYDKVDGRSLAGPNDIVFDQHGGFWFTDLGKHRKDMREGGGIFHAMADGSSITRVVDNIGANGIGLSPDGKTLYVALTGEQEILAFQVAGPGRLADAATRGRLVLRFPGRTALDSLAISASGRICVATVLEQHGVASVHPETGAYEVFGYPDWMTTNICFGGADMRDAWVTLSESGRLVKSRWPEPGLRLAHYA